MLSRVVYDPKSSLMDTLVTVLVEPVAWPGLEETASTMIGSVTSRSATSRAIPTHRPFQVFVG